MSEGIEGKVLFAHLEGKTLTASFKSNKGHEYFINGLSMVFGHTDFENKMIKMYHDGWCMNDDVKYEKVALRIHFPLEMRPPYHLSDEDFLGQEAYLYLNSF